MTKKILILLSALVCFSGCAFFNMPLVPQKGPLHETVISGYGPNKILLVDISGTITMEGKSQLGGLSQEPSLVARIKEELDMAQSDPAVKAIVLKINSPGGMVTASDIIHHELGLIKKHRNIKIVACLMELGTSGAYYIATAADRIVAHPTTITGSIGVMVLKVSLADLMQKWGIQEETVTSGDKKDILMPYRSMSEDERKVVQQIVDQLQGRFMQVVRDGRPIMKNTQLETISDGRILSPQQARDLGLIDKIGYLDDAIRTAAGLAKLPNFQIVRYQYTMGDNPNIYTQAKMSAEQPMVNPLANSTLSGLSPSFMYLWMP